MQQGILFSRPFSTVKRTRRACLVCEERITVQLIISPISDWALVITMMENKYMGEKGIFNVRREEAADARCIQIGLIMCNLKKCEKIR